MGFFLASVKLFSINKPSEKKFSKKKKKKKKKKKRQEGKKKVKVMTTKSEFSEDTLQILGFFFREYTLVFLNVLMESVYFSEVLRVCIP